VEAQARQVLKNLRAVVQAAGGEPADFVKLTLLLADINDFAKINEIMAAFFKAPFPARATYAVAALPKAARIEIEAVAVLAAEQAPGHEGTETSKAQ
jgi:reactive intermediate/imine deaminase